METEPVWFVQEADWGEIIEVGAKWPGTEIKKGLQLDVTDMNTWEKANAIEQGKTALRQWYLELS